MSEKPPSTPTTGRRKWTELTIWVGVIVILSLLPLFVKSPYHLHIINMTFIFIIATVSFRAIAISGQFPLAHGAFMGIGAYLAGMASKWLGWPPSLTIPLAALASAGIGMLIGYPFARLRALYYALGTLFFGIAVTTFIVAFPHWTGGSPGLTGIEPLFASASKVTYFYFFLGLTVFSLAILYRFEFSRIGTSLKAIAQSHLVASSVGINEAWFRILAVGVGCFFAGLAGAAYAHYNVVLSYYTFNFMATLWIVMYALIGGIGSFAGPIIGTAILVLIPEFFRDLKIYSPYISAGILIIVVYLMPQGLVSLPRLIRSWYTKRRKGERIAHAS
jgi:branched-chain amino acid transport system permease protein